MATKENHYYRIFYRGSSAANFFFRLHPATKELYSKGELDTDLCHLLLSLMDENPEHRPKSIREIREFPYFSRDILPEEEAISELKRRLEMIQMAL